MKHHILGIALGLWLLPGIGRPGVAAQPDPQGPFSALLRQPVIAILPPETLGTPSPDHAALLGEAASRHLPCPGDTGPATRDEPRRATGAATRDANPEKP